jgi:Meiotically up-regulated gene 113
MVYFIQAIDGGPIKIGCSSDVERRRRHLEYTYGRSLVVLAVMDGGPEREKEIHEKFSRFRIGGTEQFRPVAELMAFIGHPLLVTADPNSVEAMPSRLNPFVVQIRGSEEWKVWIEEIADKEGDTVAKLFERALRKFAKESGYPDPPRR